VGVHLGGADFDFELDELAQLARTAGYKVVDRIVCNRKAPDPALFVGSGKAEEMKCALQALGATEVLFDQALSPVQQRNLERFLGVAVNDRTLLILEIFAQRAQSHEGKLQVELARLQYLATRLVRRWSHLERQRGGVGHRGGPGEAQIELDRRMLADGVKRTKDRLDKALKQRITQRKHRSKADGFSIALVGYTNAGKSSLFGALTKKSTYAADQLFATLDTVTRQLYLQGMSAQVTLSDTVGFIRNLPHTLVKAFGATLQEVQHADLLLHVVDASSARSFEQMRTVQEVLSEIGAGNVAQLIVFNKLDALSEGQMPLALSSCVEMQGQTLPSVYVSAHTGQGLDQLRLIMVELLDAQARAQAQPERDVRFYNE
jgi:GTP-binding protein HflX